MVLFLSDYSWVIRLSEHFISFDSSWGGVRSVRARRVARKKKKKG